MRIYITNPLLEEHIEWVKERYGIRADEYVEHLLFNELTHKEDNEFAEKMTD